MFEYCVIAAPLDEWEKHFLCMSGDGIVDCKDACPKDRDNDSDKDSVCGDVDACPLDGQNDEDEDDLCANQDPCPRDPGLLFDNARLYSFNFLVLSDC